MTNVIEPVKVDLNEDIQTMYPQCQICFKNIGRKVCSTAVKEKDGSITYLVICGACYTLWMRLHKFASHGLIKNDE